MEVPVKKKDENIDGNMKNSQIPNIAPNQKENSTTWLMYTICINVQEQISLFPLHPVPYWLHVQVRIDT
jgi:hypothetical protein